MPNYSGLVLWLIAEISHFKHSSHYISLPFRPAGDMDPNLIFTLLTTSRNTVQVFYL
jgi:hypothetical protein